MSTNYHTAIATGAAANASTINTPLGTIDAAITAHASSIASLSSDLTALENEIVDARGGKTDLDARLDLLDTRIDNIVYGGVDLTDPLVFDSGLTINDSLRMDVSRLLNEDDSGKINLPVWLTGTFTTPGDGYSVRMLYCAPTSEGTDDILTLAPFYSQTIYGNTGGLLTHGWGGVFRFYKTGNGGNITLCAGAYVDFVVSGSGNIAAACGIFQNPAKISAGTLAQAFMADLNEPEVSGSGVVEDNYGIRVGSTTVGTDSNYGIYIEASNGYGLYSVSKAYIGGTLEVAAAASIDADLDVTNGDVTIVGDSTLGADLVTNGGFASDTTGWTASSATLSNKSGGQSGNCLQVANNSGTGYAYQAITTEVGKWYQLNFYYKTGTAASATWAIGTSAGGTQIDYASLSTAAAWRLSTVNFQAVGTTTYLRFGPAGGTGTENSLFDTISVKELQGGDLGVNGTITGYGGTIGLRIASTGKAAYNAATITGSQLAIRAADASALAPLGLQQADVDQHMIEFDTTIGTGNAIEAVGAKTLTTTHFIKVLLPGGLTRYIPCGTIT